MVKHGIVTRCRYTDTLCNLQGQFVQGIQGKQDGSDIF